MANTLVFAEILIVGLQAMVWVALVSMTVAGETNIPFKLFQGSAGAATFILLALSYGLGVVVDRIADIIFMPFDCLLRKIYKIDYESIIKMRYTICSKNEGLTKKLYYLRGRIRISRSTALNVLAILLTSIFFINGLPNIIISASTRNALSVLIIIGGGLITLLAIVAWIVITITWYRRVKLSYGLV